MLSIKLVRTGKKNLPSFRVVVGAGKKIVEILGYYYPHSKAPQFQVKKGRIEYWLNSGAHLTDAVDLLLKGKYEFQRYLPQKSGGRVPVVGGGKPESEKPPEPAVSAAPEAPGERQKNA